MTHEEKLPWDLIEEILSRVPPKSLVRFRTACKQWNNLFNDKKFINNHKMTFRFVLKTKTKIYSVNVTDVEIQVRELTLDIPGLDESHEIPKNIVGYNEFLLCRNKQEVVVWNPWLSQSRWIQPDFEQFSTNFHGMGYDNKNCYKILASLRQKEDPTKSLWKIYDFVSDAWNDYYHLRTGGDTDSTQKQNGWDCKLINNSVSLDGTLYFFGSHHKIIEEEEEEDSLFIACFHFSTEKFFVFCDLPCERNHVRDALVLGVFKGDRFSLLKQCFATKKIEIWVTKNKISNIWDCVEGVVWISFMQVSVPNFPDLVKIESYYQPSYFIDDKRRLVVCFCDETGRAWIYVVSENKLISKTRIDSVVNLWPSHCTYTPSLVPVPPPVRREQIELQV